MLAHTYATFCVQYDVVPLVHYTQYRIYTILHLRKSIFIIFCNNFIIHVFRSRNIDQVNKIWDFFFWSGGFCDFCKEYGIQKNLLSELVIPGHFWPLTTLQYSSQIGICTFFLQVTKVFFIKMILCVFCYVGRIGRYVCNM